VGSLPTALSDAAAATMDGTTYVVGGETSGPGAPIATVLALRLL
jgi:N-acetylneuraminic acid mutarotase